MEPQTIPDAGSSSTEIPPTTLSYDPNFEFPAQFPADPSTATQTFVYQTRKVPENGIVSVATGFAYVGAIIPVVALVAFILGLIGYYNSAGRQGIRRRQALAVIIVSGAFTALQLVSLALLYRLAILNF